MEGLFQCDFRYANLYIQECSGDAGHLIETAKIDGGFVPERSSGQGSDLGGLEESVRGGRGSNRWAHTRSLSCICQ